MALSPNGKAMFVARKIGGAILTVLVLFIFPPLVGCYGGAAFSAVTLPQIPEWRQLGSPPEAIEELLAADFDQIFVRTIDKKIYSCYWASPYDSACWVKVDEIPEIFVGYCDPADPTGPAAPRPPSGKVIQEILFENCGTFFGGSTDYSVFAYYLLEDGTVLQWGYDEFHFFPMPGMFKRLFRNIIVFWFMAVILGLVLSIRIINWAFSRPKTDPTQRM